MAFKFERIQQGDPVESTEQYQHAVALYFGLPHGHRIVDSERNYALYCAGVNRYEERPPGTYLLFIGNDVVTIHAFQLDSTSPRVTQKGERLYFITSIDVPLPLLSQVKEVNSLIKEALSVVDPDELFPPSVVNFAFPKQ
jgi:hypothetical protein